MTEAEWLECGDPEPMLQYLKRAGFDRKLRLFGVQCCRHIENWMKDQRSRHAVNVSEQYADGLVGNRQLSAARRGAFAARKISLEPEPPNENDHIAQTAASVALYACLNQKSANKEGLEFVSSAINNLAVLLAGEDWRCASETDLRRQIEWLNDIFGNPFRPVAFDPRWRTADVLGLARGIYDERAFDRLPLLADALMDAGCAEEEILAHCRGEGPHFRGCWVVDLVLGKE